jgi:hypothetical protein
LKAEEFKYFLKKKTLITSHMEWDHYDEREHELSDQIQKKLKSSFIGYIGVQLNNKWLITIYLLLVSPVTI